MKYPPRFVNRLFFLLSACILLTSGCAKIHHATAEIESANFLNPNIYQQPSPVVVVIYQLKSPTTFQQANFFALSDNAQTLLGSELLDKREMEIRPGQKQSVSMDLSPEANYIGIIAEFRNPDIAQWRQVKQIKPGKNVKLKIHLSTQNLSVDLD